MKVLVLWAEPNVNPNLGVRVLAEGSAHFLRQAFGDSVVVDYQDFGPAGSGVTFGRRAILEDIFTKRKVIANRLSNFDLVYDTGAGDSFTDSYGMRRLLQMVYVQAAAARLGIPLVLGPQTIGPFRNRLARALARRTLRSARVVLVRDPDSGSVARAFGRGPDALSTDVVFSLDTSCAESKTRDVILNVSGLLWSPNRHVDNSIYQNGIRAIIAALLADGRRVTLLPHVVGRDVPLSSEAAADNDVPVSIALAAEFAHENLEVIVPTSLPEARSILSSGVVAVGSRMHACLNAISMGTPAVPLAYSKKFEPLLSDLKWSGTVDLRTTPGFASEVLGIVRNADTVAALATDTERVRYKAAEKLSTAVRSLQEALR